MSIIRSLIAAYRAHVTLPWQPGLSASERVWMLVYPPDQERKVRASLGEFELATKDADRAWAIVDLSDAFGDWIARHEYAEAFFEDPSDLTSSLIEDFEAVIVTQVRNSLAAAPRDGVVALMGAGALYPYVRVSRVIDAVESTLQGCLLVFFPGQVNQTTHTYRLLDARDGFSYRAAAITIDDSNS